MITIVYCTREHNQKHIDHLKKMAGHPKVQVIERINNGESLTVSYNELLKQADHDIVVFCHDDIEVQTKQFARKIKKHFDNTDYGILGVAGTKVLDESGKWWADPRKMIGRVWHTHLGKKRQSKYSDDQGTGIEETAVVDGVFFSVMKSRLKKDFDESVEGFHFYDLDFCLRNRLEGVKVGVHTNISINHMSIGETNEQWEENRVLFAEKYKDSLPLKIDKVFKDNHKFKVLIACLNFNGLTGSELYNYELAKGLVERGCEVTICSRIGGELAFKAKQAGIKLSNIEEPLGFKKGDGKWQIQKPDGTLEKSVENKLYKMAPANFDIMHLNHTPVTNLMLQLYPEIPAIASIHSEVISLEHPVVHDNIKKYIAIRPEIKDFITSGYDIPEEKISVIYNPIDTNRFQPKDTLIDEKITLFVGTIDYLRKNMLSDLIERTKKEGSKLWVIGKENGVTVDSLINDSDTHVTYHGVQRKVENYINQCTETAGILLGRTTIEGWLCGKAGWIYDVDDKGIVLGKKLHPVPTDVDKYKRKNVVTQIIEEYKEIIK